MSIKFTWKLRKRHDNGLASIVSVLKGKIARNARGHRTGHAESLSTSLQGLIEQFIESGAGRTNLRSVFGVHNGALSDGEIGAATINRNFRGRATRRRTNVSMQFIRCRATVVAGEIIDPDNEEVS